MTKAERTKQLIITAAAPIFNRKGIAGTTVDDVLDAAGVARGCLYNHFLNKDDLAFAVSEYLVQRTSEAILKVMHKENTAQKKILAFIDFYKNPLNTYTEGGCPLYNLAVEADNNNASIKDMLKKAISGAQKHLSDVIREGIDQGEFDPRTDADVLALKIFTSIEGAIIYCRITDTNKPMQSLIKDLKSDLSRHLSQ